MFLYNKKIKESQNSKIPKNQKKVNSQSTQMLPPIPTIIEDDLHFVEVRLDTDVYDGVVIHTINVKDKYPKTPTIYVVTILKHNNRSVSKPYIKWVNKTYCIDIKPFSTKYKRDNDIFNLERMYTYEKAKKKK